ncbi:hypothetical protein CK203_093707 [Vitis vinifera]|uniref:Reverse transcriptase domain-containing protein n=1 Tax=Vitis vinifera TaxID=29760 RepID=A0A438D1Z6_VITVI|nr:hypothetical protein CK203_093707 [Vitis vinifera]
MQEMSRMIVRSLGVGRCLDWKVLNSRGAFWRCAGVLGQEGAAFIGSGSGELFCVLQIQKLAVGEADYLLQMRRFSEIMEDLELRDLPLQGGSFTWKGGLNNQSHSRLDRFLISNEWEDHFSGSVQYVLPKPTSDHFPILLDGGGVRSGPMPFRFENMWLKEEGFKEKMQGWWVGLNCSGSASYVLVSKLKALKSLLRDWNKLEFGKVEVNKALALSQVDFWDKMELSRTLSVQEVDAKRGAKEDFKKWALMEEISWRQKSREVWLREGDRNTKFFHKMANVTGGGTCYPGPSLRGLSFERLEAVDAASLEESFSEQEVMEALKGFCGDKAPGPDGFFYGFWQSSSGVCERGGGAEDLRDFRPISLVGGLYKWLAKVLANRLKRVVGKVVSKAQNAFVQGRQILDAVLVANEVLDSVLKNKEEAVMFMRKMGFGEKWIRWMKWCISTVSFSVLVNGLPQAVAGGFVSACKARSKGGEGVNVSDHTFSMSGLRINLDKSELIPVGCVNNVEELAAALVKSQTEVRADSEGVLMGGGALERKIHLVKWELVCLEKDNGGGKIWGGARGMGVQRKQGGRRMVWDAWVKDVWRCNEGGGSWSPLFSRPFNDWELEEQRGERLSPWINFKGEVGSSEQMLSLSKNMKNQLITFFFIVKRLELFGCCSTSMSGCKWVLPATVKETLSGWNGSLWGRRGRVFGKQVLCAFFGRFGRQGTKLLLRKRSCQSKDSKLLLFIFFGRRRRVRGGYRAGVRELLGRGGIFASIEPPLKFVTDKRVKFWTDKWCGDEPLYLSFPSLYALAASKKA